MYEIKSLLTILKEGYEGVGEYEQKNERKEDKNVKQANGVLVQREGKGSVSEHRPRFQG